MNETSIDEDVEAQAVALNKLESLLTFNSMAKVGLVYSHDASSDEGSARALREQLESSFVGSLECIMLVGNAPFTKNSGLDLAEDSHGGYGT